MFIDILSMCLHYLLYKGESTYDFGGAYTFGYFQLFSYVLISDLIPYLIYKPVGIES